MSPRKRITPVTSLASPSLQDAYIDFILRCKGKECTKSTLDFYYQTVHRFLAWGGAQGRIEPPQYDAKLVRVYIAKLIDEGKADSTVNDHARAIRTLLRFWHEEKYIPEPVKFGMPKIAKKRLPVLSAEEVVKVLNICDTRERAALLLLADTGLRRAEAVALNWGDVDISSGLIRVVRGKGGKARSVVIGVLARKALLAYRRTLADHSAAAPLIRSKRGRFTGGGLLQLIRRLSREAGIKFSPHALRRTFVIQSLRAGMSALHLQALGGWAIMDMVAYYADMQNEDLLAAHKEHSPMDNLNRLK